MVAMIRSLGNDCSDASAIPPRMPDVDVLRMAAATNRIIVTSDKDSGELVFVYRIACPGVILVRVAMTDEADRVAFVRSIWSTVISRLPGSFVTRTASGIRVRPII